MTPNTVVVYAATYSTDADGSPTRSDGAGVSFSVAIDIESEPTREANQGTILGVDVYKMIFYADPGVIAPDTRIDWTADVSGTFATPVRFMATGAAIEPLGRCKQWVVRATLRS
jgi:hypothetical protein